MVVGTPSEKPVTNPNLPDSSLPLPLLLPAAAKGGKGRGIDLLCAALAARALSAAGTLSAFAAIALGVEDVEKSTESATP